MRRPSRKATVLVVDDNAATRENLAKLLFLVPDVTTVGDAASGQEALTQAMQLQPNVVLLDLTLPDVDGFELVETIANRLPRTRIVLMSKEGAAHYLLLPLADAVRALLIKPITTDALTKAIRHASQE